MSGWSYVLLTAAISPIVLCTLVDIENLAPQCSTVNITLQRCIVQNTCRGQNRSERCELTFSVPPGSHELIEIHHPHQEPTTLEKWGLGLLSVSLVSLSGVWGALLWPIMETKLYKHLMRTLIGLAMGSLISTSLFQLIPEGFKLNETDEEQQFLNAALFSWLSIWGLFVIEYSSKLILKGRSHEHGEARQEPVSIGKPPETEIEMNGLLSKPHPQNSEAEPKVKKAVASVAWMIIFGDGIHNFIDGISIGAGFSLSVSTGIGISLAIMCEEFPHELGDFAILIRSGMSVKKALGFNFLSACAAFLGLFVGIALGDLEGSHRIFSFAGGLFLYISLSHLVPEFQQAFDEALKVSRKEAAILFALQNVGILTGTAVLYLITYYNSAISSLI